MELTLHEHLAAPLEKALEAWSTAEGWNGWFTSGAQLDFRVGGAYSNDDHDVGEFQEIDIGAESAHIVFTWDNAKHCPGTVVTVDLDRDGSTTPMRLVHSGLADQAAYEDMLGGWTWALSSLKSWLETGARVPCES